jgi:hypothetical protein
MPCKLVHGYRTFFGCAVASIQGQEVQELDLDYLGMLGPVDEDYNILRNVCMAKRPINYSNTVVRKIK